MTSEDRIARLESQLERLETRETELRAQLAKAQLDQWYARIEDFELQAHLGAMEAGDRVHTLMDEARDVWHETVHQVERPVTTAAEAVDAVRGRLEGLLRDIRAGLRDAAGVPSR